eukprot:TRINITY_DN27542_c0_g1_i1.p1 TRINITY_DN27542_c0_g1~~TRINITY_DN27542_c0_g1_i1.p1  ORF type:complete len:286 (+),score=31.73 TRINITY_DN27542_c0_g1_i1:3-860(+)
MGGGGYGMGMGGGYGMQRYGMQNGGMQGNLNNLNNQNGIVGQGQQQGQQGQNPQGQQMTRAQIVLSGAQEVTQAFVSLVEVSIQFAILAMSAWCTYSQVQQVNQVPGASGPNPMGESLMAKAATVAAPAVAKKSSGWFSKATRRQLLTLTISVTIYAAVTKLLSKLNKALTPQSGAEHHIVHRATQHLSTAVEKAGSQEHSTPRDEDLLADHKEAISSCVTGEVLCTTLYDYEARGADELSFQQSDHLIIHEQSGEWWTASHASSPEKQGLVPSNYLQFVNKNKI